MWEFGEKRKPDNEIKKEITRRQEEYALGIGKLRECNTEAAGMMLREEGVRET